MAKEAHLEDIAELTRLINNKVSEAMNFRVGGWFSEQLQPLLSHATRRFSEMFAEVDRITGERGLAEAARYLLSFLIKSFEIRGNV